MGVRSVRKTNLEVNQLIKNSKLKWIDGEYLGNESILTCIDESNYIVTIRVTTVEKLVFPNIFSTRNPYSTLNFQNFLKLKGLNYLALGEYNGMRESITCLDLDSGYKLEVSISNILRGRFTNAPFRSSNPNSTENVKALIKNKGLDYELLNEFEGSYELLKLKDKDGYILTCDIGRLRTRYGLLKFHSSNPYTLDNIKLFMSKFHPLIKYNLDKYKGKNTRLDCTCLLSGCDHKWSPTLDSLQRGHSCPRCAFKITGWNRSSWIKRGIKSKRFDGFKLYKVRLYNENEEFYKIGITFNKINFRLSEIPYKYQILEIIKSDSGEYIYDLENELHRQHKKMGYLYQPIIKFGGDTECFTNLIEITSNNTGGNIDGE